MSADENVTIRISLDEMVEHVKASPEFAEVLEHIKKGDAALRAALDATAPCDGHGGVFTAAEVDRLLTEGMQTYEEAEAIKRTISFDRSEVARLTALLHECNAVCLCGCPAGDHEADDCGESCADEAHECIRVAPAVLAYVNGLRSEVERLTRERDEALISRDEWRRHAEEQLADVLRLRFLGIEFASQYGDRALACKYDNSCDDSGREPACIPCAFRYALGLMGVN